MSATTKVDAGDLIVEPIAEAVAMYDDLLKQLREFMVSKSRYSYPSELSPWSWLVVKRATEMHDGNP